MHNNDNESPEEEARLRDQQAYERLEARSAQLVSWLPEHEKSRIIGMATNDPIATWQLSEHPDAFLTSLAQRIAKAEKSLLLVYEPEKAVRAFESAALEYQREQQRFQDLIR